MSDVYIQINNKKFIAFIKALKLNIPHVEVGILGDTDARNMANKGDRSNASIGIHHEYGAPEHNLVQRSFLRMPLNVHFGKDLEKSGLFDKEVLKKVIADQSITQWVYVMARCAEATVGTAFDSGGYGLWKTWKDPKYKNNTGKLLQDSTQLRDSITSRVVV